MTDPIADMLTRIRNAARVHHPRLEIPYSRPKVAIAEVMKAEGYIGDVAVVERGKFKYLRITLRYDEEGKGFISGLSMVSKPGKRVYSRHDAIPLVMGGIGLSIVSTSRGVMSGRQARKSRVGGEILCHVW